MTDNSLTARDYLEHHAAPEPGAEVTVTGYSLGGALSPSYALYLYDTQGDRGKHGRGWDARCNVTLNCLPVAGATPGDKVFSDYYYERLGGRTNRYWNKKDVVPHAWEIDMLYQIPTLYAPTIKFDFSDDALLYSLLTLLWALTSGKHYTQLRADRSFAEDSTVIPVSGDDTFHRFLSELGYQHIDRYGQIFQISQFQDAVTRIVPLPQKFFTSLVTKEQSDQLRAQISALVAKHQVSPEMIQTFAAKSAAQ
ncbi:MAG: hypothetical protein HC890_06650 [Chloroflexaceae bacterium]|nr:hypothetical protein [Chloroflexaceae bacterium]